MISYKYHKENEILSVTLAGKVDLKNIFDYLEKVFSDDLLPLDLKILYDLRKAELDISPDDIDSLNKFSRRTSEHFNNVKSAFLTTLPNQTALSLMFTIKNPYSNLSRNVFTTQDVAIEWLLSEEDDES